MQTPTTLARSCWSGCVWHVRFNILCVGGRPRAALRLDDICFGPTLKPPVANCWDNLFVRMIWQRDAVEKTPAEKVDAKNRCFLSGLAPRLVIA